jgi:hypothetical protein
VSEKFVSKAVDENADGLDPCRFLKFCKQIVLSVVPCFSNLQLQGSTLNGFGGSSTEIHADGWNLKERK